MQNRHASKQMMSLGNKLYTLMDFGNEKRSGQQSGLGQGVVDCQAHALSTVVVKNQKTLILAQGPSKLAGSGAPTVLQVQECASTFPSTCAP